MHLRPRHLVIPIVAVACLLPAVAQARRWVVVRTYAPGALPICRVERTTNLVALSFDDGPTARFTQPILRTLAAAGARATFFVVGERAAANPDTLAAEVGASMEIGDHTWSHAHIPTMPPDALAAEISRTEATLSTLAAPRSMLFRPPFGEIGPTGLAVVANGDLRAIGWSVAVDRYLRGAVSPDDAARRIAGDVRAGDILLAHDGGADRSWTVDLLGPLLEQLTARDLRVVPIGELLEAGRPIRATPQPWFWQAGFSCPDGG